MSNHVEKCSFPGCKNPVLAKSACQLHVSQLCLARGCVKRAVAQGFCYIHRKDKDGVNRLRPDLHIAIRPDVHAALEQGAQAANMDVRTYIQWVFEQLWAPQADKIVPPRTAVDYHGRPLAYRTKDGARFKRRCAVSPEVHALLDKHAAAMGWAKSSYARWVLEKFWVSPENWPTPQDAVLE